MTISGNGQMKKSPEQLEREIDQERQHLLKTLDAIGGKFSADELLHRVSDYARKNGSEFSRNLVNTVARNPVPTMLTAIGIGWMLYQYNRPQEHRPVSVDEESSSWSSTGTTNMTTGTTNTTTGTAKQRAENLGESVSHRVDQLRESAGQRSEQLRDSSGQKIDQLRETAGMRAEQLRQSGHATKENLKNKASGLKSRLETSAGDLKHRISETSAGLRDRADHLRHASQRQAQRASDGFNYMVEEQPLVLGAVGIALGALIGAVLPSTRREDRLMGSVSDRAADEARAVAHEAIDKASELGKKVQGYAAEDAREKAAEFGRDVQDYAKSEARETASEVGKSIQDHTKTDSKSKTDTSI